MKIATMVARLALCLLVVGCAANKPWGKGTATGALIGGAIGGAGAVGVQYGRGRDQPSQVGEAGAIGVAAGMLIGGVLGHVFLDEEEAPRAEEKKPAVAEAGPEPVPSPVAERVIPRGVHFAFNQATLQPEAVRSLDDVASYLTAERPQSTVLIAGYTDSTGEAEYNMSLGLRRAEVVRHFLVSKGIQDGRLRVKSFGASNPVASNETADGRAQNRRVELNIENGH